MGAERTTVKVLIGGSGGQGVLTLGKVVAYAGLEAALEVSCLPSYSAEMRGGYVHCSVVLSRGKSSFSPVISRADIGVFMNERAYAMLSPSVESTGVLIVNSSFISPPGRRGRVLAVKATECAEELGSLRAANMLMAGMLGWALIRCGIPLDLDHIRSGIEQVFPGGAEQEISRKAAACGWEAAREQWKE